MVMGVMGGVVGFRGVVGVKWGFDASYVMGCC